MLEMGQPLHAFDYERLRENRIVVRRAQNGENFTTLDGQTHTLSDEVLMICDGERPVALAGIMGGLNSEIFAGSKNVLVESACFDPITIRRASKRLGLSTEASYRFERGTDIKGVVTALQRALMLISRMAGGRIIKDVMDNYPRPHQGPVIDLRLDATNLFLGTHLSKETVAGYLRALEMEVQDVEDNVIRVKPPSFRVDITREEDLTEEVARLEGYDRIPVTYPAIRPSDETDIPELVTRDKTQEILAGLGFTEIITYSFISPESIDLLGVTNDNSLRSFVKLLNPLSTEQSVMRTSLVPALLATVKTNVFQLERNLRFFEWGKVFIHSDTNELPHEKLFLAGIMTGFHNPKEWYCEQRSVDYYDIKGTVEGLLKALGMSGFLFRKGEIPPYYHPDVSSLTYLSGSVIGSLGQVAPEVMERYDLRTQSAYLFELDIGRLMEKAQGIKRFKPFARFPAVFRDLSIIVERQTECARIQEIIENEGGVLVESVNLFDLYEGETIGPSEKTLTFRICYRSKNSTLDGVEINKLHESIIDEIGQKTGGKLREG
jgi:phenylalanyl-tRNA synthetase beta chain